MRSSSRTSRTSTRSRRCSCYARRVCGEVGAAARRRDPGIQAAAAVDLALCSRDPARRGAGGQTARPPLRDHEGARQGSAEEINQIRGIGEAIAAAVAGFLAEPKNRKLIERLERLGLNMTEPVATEGGARSRADLRDHRDAPDAVARPGDRVDRGRGRHVTDGVSKQTARWWPAPVAARSSTGPRHLASRSSTRRNSCAACRRNPKLASHMTATRSAAADGMTSVAARCGSCAKACSATPRTTRSRSSRKRGSPPARAFTEPSRRGSRSRAGSPAPKTSTPPSSRRALRLLPAAAGRRHGRRAWPRARRGLARLAEAEPGTTETPMCFFTSGMLATFWGGSRGRRSR